MSYQHNLTERGKSMKKPRQLVLITRSLAVVLALGMALICGTATAQEEGEQEEYLLEEITVTAEFREKTIQDTPLAITAFNAEMLEVRNQVTLDQISAQAPSVMLRPNNSGMGSSLVAFIRGVGQTDFNPSVEPGVAIYVDDVYYATITGNIIELLDLERVEILRGPQGTLAGRNAIGGAIKLFTRKPDGEDDGSVSVTYGDFDRLDVKAQAGFTILPDKLFARVAGVSRSRDGYVTRLDYACANGLGPPGTPGGLPTYTTAKGGLGCELGKEGGQSMTAGRLSLRWLVSDNFEVNFSTNIVRDKSESQPSVLIAAADNSGHCFPWYSPNGPSFDPNDPFTCTGFEPWPGGCGPNNPAFNPNSITYVPTFYDNDGDGQYTAGIDVAYDSRFVTGGTYYNYATYIHDGRSTPYRDPVTGNALFQGGTPGADNSVYKPDVLPPINHFESKDFTLSLDWQLSNNVSLRSVTSYREYLNTFANDEDESPLGLGQLLQRMDHEQWTQELRLNASLWDGYADLTLGGFYLDKETNEDARVDINYAAFDFLHGPDIVPSKSKALYGHLALHISDRTDLSLGLRYTEDEKSYTFHRHNPDGSPVQACNTFWFWEAGNPANCGVYGLDGSSIAYSSDRFDWRAALDYDLTKDIMVYGQIATGYKAGGNNARPFFPSQLHATEPEELINYEIGMKSTLFDRLRLNGALFYNDYTDMQLMVSECYWAPVGETTPCASVDNVGDAEVTGLELEALWYPTEEITVDLSYAYLDFEYTSIDPLTGISPDSSAPFTPENKFSVGAQYRFELSKGLGDLTPRIDYSWQDDTYTSALNTTGTFVPSYGIVNGRLTWRSEDLKWQAAIEVTNIADEYYYLTQYDLMTGAGYVNGQPGRPIEWAFTIKRSWF
jgi:iron complex outermembrane receptor protein